MGYSISFCIFILNVKNGFVNWDFLTVLSAKKIRKDFLALTLDLWYNIAQ